MEIRVCTTTDAHAVLAHPNARWKRRHRLCSLPAFEERFFALPYLPALTSTRLGCLLNTHRLKIEDATGNGKLGHPPTGHSNAQPAVHCVQPAVQPA